MGAKQHYHLYYCLLPKVYHRELCCYVKQILSIEIITLVLIGTLLPSLDGGGGEVAVGNDRSLEKYPYRWMKRAWKELLSNALETRWVLFCLQVAVLSVK